MLHKLKAKKLNTLLCLGAAVCLLFAGLLPGFAAARAEAADGVRDVIELNPIWGKGGLIEGRTYVTGLIAETSNEPEPDGGAERILSSDSADTRSASYSLFYQSPGDYWYTLSIGRQGETDPIEVYYVHVSVLYYDSDGELHASSTFRVGSKTAVKCDFTPEDPDFPENPTPTEKPGGNPTPTEVPGGSPTPTEGPGGSPTPTGELSGTPTPTGEVSEVPTPTGTTSGTPTPTGTSSKAPTPTGTSKNPTPTATTWRPTVTPGTSITTSPGKTSAAKTGDASNTALYTILLAASAVLIFLIADNMRRNEK